MTGGPGGNFLEQLLGDLMQLMGGGGDRLELARSLAYGVATGGQPEPNVEPVERIRFEELARVAEMHVDALTGLETVGATPAFEVVGPGAWARRTVDDWGFLLEAMTATGPPPPATHGVEEGRGELMARFMLTMAPMMAGMQLGSAVGHLARSTLGSYEIPIPRPAGHLLLVPANVDAFARDWSLPDAEVRLWVCLREITVARVLARSHVADRIRSLLVDVVRGGAADAGAAIERLQTLDPTDPEALHQVLGDPESLMGPRSAESERAAEALTAVLTALTGYVEHVLDGTATRLLGGRGALAEAWRRRQVARESAARSAEMLVGLDLGPALIDRGAAFAQGVVERAGEEGLARLWESERTLPTPAEVDAPGLWLERVSFDPPAGRPGPAA